MHRLMIPAALTAIPVRGDGEQGQNPPPATLPPPETAPAAGADAASAIPTVPATNPELRAVTEAIRESRYPLAAERLKKIKVAALDAGPFPRPVY